MRRFSSLLLRSIPRRYAAESNQKVQIPRGLSQNPYMWKWNRNRSFLIGNTFSSYNKQQYMMHGAAHFSGLSLSIEEIDNENRNDQLLEVEIISEEHIKPASPTPDHLRTYEVSVLDQLFGHIYVPFVYFYQNNVHHDNRLNLIKRRQLLKQSLSEVLSRFYPLAGKVKGSRHIDCNDEGVYYVEAKVNGPLSDFLINQPHTKSIHRFLPVDPNSMELLFSKTYVVMIQVTAFDCGGIAIGLYTSHKIIDGVSQVTFLKAWADAALAHNEEEEEEEIIRPSFISPSIFPPNPALPENAAVMLFIANLEQKKCVTRRFLFNSSSIMRLKKKAIASTRAMAVTGLIWKCIVAASKARSKASNCIARSSAMRILVNLRNKGTTPISPHAIGNILWLTDPIQYSRSDDDDDDLEYIVGRLKNATDQISDDFVERMKGEEWSLKVGDKMNEMKKEYFDTNADTIALTSLCNMGIYEIDFGWGKPIWASIGNAYVDISLVNNFVMLMDVKSGNGVEAWVTLSEENMAFLENDPELLAFASLNPNPLETID
ncbi:hypothetical protein ACJIZ3_011565 [Penstemon smallii]|uniref:Uncharacterized protein n=1 Tax=Penstemon smallii TaxID=265156 RepID=A0ABD3UMC0_9LAMI